MYGLLEYAIPFMIAMVFLGFILAWILSAPKPPESAVSKVVPGALYPRWNDLDSGPEGIRKNLAQEITRQAKSV